MKAKRILSLFMVLVLLVCLLPTVYAAEDTELDAELEDLGFTSDQLIQSYVELADSEDSGIAAYSYNKTATLQNCDSMRFTCSNGKNQGFHYADEDGSAPWDYMNMIYCLERDKSFSYGEGHAGSDDLPLDGAANNHGEEVWYSLSDDQRYAVALILLYGAPGNLWDDDWGINADGDHDMHNPNIGYRFATQALIWEITSGLREPVYPYTLLDSYWYDIFVGQCTTEDGSVDHFLVGYNFILDNLRLHNVIPSFTGDFSATAKEIQLTGTTTTVTDTNGVLSRFEFTNTSGVTYTKSGNKLTISVSGTVPTTVQSAVATLPNPEASLYEVWFNQYNDSYQTCIRVSIPSSDPVPAYFKLSNVTGNLALVKTTEDGLNLGGWRFGIYSDEACTKLVSGSYPTNNLGQIKVSGLPEGDYWIKEIGHYSSAINALYQCDSPNPQKVTIVSGQTATVSFHNKLHWGTCKIIKVLSNPEARTVEGWSFTVHQINGSTTTYLTTVTTDATGTISVDLEPGDYLITEVLAEDSQWECTSGLSQTIAATAGQTVEVTFVNALRSGSIEIQKVDTYGQSLAGVEFLLEWSTDGENWYPVTFTDVTVPQIGGCTSASLTDGKLKTDANGAVAFEGLYSLLQYRLSETATLDGYQLLADYAYVGGLSVEDDFTVALTVVNAPVFELPATGSHSFILMPIALVLCLATCTGALVLLRKKEGR